MQSHVLLLWSMHNHTTQPPSTDHPDHVIVPIVCWDPFPWWLVFHNWRQSFINVIICGGLSPTNWRHFFLFAINHGKCSCLYLQRMPINWHSMKRRKSSQSLLQFFCFEFPFESQESSRREEGKMRGSENRGCSFWGISTPGRV